MTRRSSWRNHPSNVETLLRWPLVDFQNALVDLPHPLSNVHDVHYVHSRRIAVGVPGLILSVHVIFALFGLPPTATYLPDNPTYKRKWVSCSLGNFSRRDQMPGLTRCHMFFLTSGHSLTRSFLEASGILVASHHHVFVVPHVRTPRRGPVLGSPENRSN